jgi:hypothetical protein
MSKMKELILKIDDGVVEELTSHMIGKKVTGNLFGVEDEFVMLILKAIDSGLTERSILLK